MYCPYDTYPIQITPIHASPYSFRTACSSHTWRTSCLEVSNWDTGFPGKGGVLRTPVSLQESLHLRGYGMLFLWVYIPTLTTFISYAQGQRFVCPQEGSTRNTLRILDFNVSPGDRQHAKSGVDVTRTICTTPTRLPRDNIFRREVVTNLTYCTTTRTIFDSYSAYMIDEDRIIGLKVRWKRFMPPLIFHLPSAFLIRPKGSEIKS
jgi:hypothetical protein